MEQGGRAGNKQVRRCRRPPRGSAEIVKIWRPDLTPSACQSSSCTSASLIASLCTRVQYWCPNLVPTASELGWSLPGACLIPSAVRPLCSPRGCAPRLAPHGLPSLGSAGSRR